MGAEHGAFCAGCCWFLMALLFYGGVMNLVWVVGLALYVLVEKVAPAGHWIGRAAGIGLIAWGWPRSVRPRLTVSGHSPP